MTRRKANEREAPAIEPLLEVRPPDLVAEAIDLHISDSNPTATAIHLAALTAQRDDFLLHGKALDQRERAIKVREYEFEQKVQEVTGQLRAGYTSLVEGDSAMKRRILNFSGMLDGFAPTIRALPDWPAIERMLGMRVDVIPEMRDIPTQNVREGTTGDGFIPGSTLTRSTPMSEHDDLPMPVVKPRERSTRSRYGYRRAMRAAMAKP
jgi:hypothetical protein